ncbi:MAG: hypothetical protein WC224_02500 [Sphaerochaetaceae bacterium]
MVKVKKFYITLLLIITCLLLVTVALPARVVASKTLTIYGYIPSKTELILKEDGEFLFTSNSLSAVLDYEEYGDMTLLSVMAL